MTVNIITFMTLTLIALVFMTLANGNPEKGSCYRKLFLKNCSFIILLINVFNHFTTKKYITIIIPTKILV